MKAVLRVALTYFNFSPLQAWVSLIALPLIATGVIVRIAGREPGGAALALSLAGAALLALGPIFGGGIMMRQLSSLPTMSLRPGVRLRLLLGTTLAMIIVVLAVMLPFLLVGRIGPGGNPLPAASTVFFIGWGVLALLWVSAFALSPYRVVALHWVIAAAVAHLFGSMPPEQLPAPAMALVAGLVLWCAFAVWYLRQRTHRPVTLALGLAMSSESAPAPAFPALTADGTPRSAPHAQRQWLWGDGLLQHQFVIGMGQALLVVVLFALVLDRPAGREKSLLGNILYFGVMFTSFFTGYWLVGRSRVLWLRSGLTRAGLLRHAETHGLLPALVAFLGAALVICATQLFIRPDLLASILLNALAQLSLGLCLAYWGLSFTHSWSIETAIGLCGGFVLWLVATITLGASRSPSFLAGCIAVLALIALLLRLHAHRRWRNLDWRVKRPEMNTGWAVRARP